jgi:hypothetical protein
MPARVSESFPERLRQARADDAAPQPGSGIPPESVWGDRWQPGVDGYGRPR